MLFHVPGGVGDTLACGICVATSEGEIDPAAAGLAVVGGEALVPAPAQPARPTVKRVSSAAPASRIRIRLDFVFMPCPALSIWLEVNRSAQPPTNSRSGLAPSGHQRRADSDRTADGNDKGPNANGNWNDAVTQGAVGRRLIVEIVELGPSEDREAEGRQSAEEGEQSRARPHPSAVQLGQAKQSNQQPQDECDRAAGSNIKTVHAHTQDCLPRKERGQANE